MKKSALLLLALFSLNIFGEDWPTYRYNGKRSGVTPANLPAKLFAQWTFQSLHAPRTAWPLPGEETPRMHTDRAYHVVAAGNTIYFGNNVDNHVHAHDTRSGKRKWSFATDGSVRFAPFVSEERIYFGSDDGHIYCVDAEKGTQIWKYRPGPSGERIIGRGRMASLWPVRTGVLVEDGVLYAAAGIFPHEGLYIVALNIKTGRPVWLNDTVGDQAWGLQYGGAAPQGYIVASSDTVYIPAGRSMPVAFDKRTGKFKKFLSGGGKIGGSWTMMEGNELFAGNNNQGADTKIAFNANSGSKQADQFANFPSIDMVLTKDTAFIATQKGIYCIDRAANRKANSSVPSLGKESAALTKSITEIRKKHKAASNNPEELKKLTVELTKATNRLSAIAKEKSTLNATRVKWFTPREGLGPMVLAGKTLFAGGNGYVISLNISDGKIAMDHAVEGHAVSLAVADSRLFVSSDNGSIHCLAAQPAQKKKSLIKETFEPINDQGIKGAADQVLASTRIKKGWCLIAGARDGRLAEYLTSTTELNIVVIEQDAKRLKVIRSRLMKTGLLGDRVIAIDWAYADLPDYFANLIVSERAMLGEEVNLPVNHLARVLRPSGGKLVLGPVNKWAPPSLEKIKNGLVANAAAQTKSQTINNHFLFTRGKLNGAGNWTGLYGNTANTSSTPDKLVKGPLGVLWYGEPGSEDMVGRHARAASPLAINGRLFMQGAEVVMAYDAYNGTFLWKRKIQGAVRVRVDVDGSNITATDDSIFVATHNRVLQLDAQTGETTREFQVPRKEADKALRWGYIAAHGNILIGTGSTPLAQEYGYLWNSLVKDGKWVDEKDAPKAALSTLKKVKGLHPLPDKRAFAYFQRSDLHWRSMIANAPGWLPDHNPSPVDEKKIMTSEKVFAYNITTGEKLWEHEGKDIPNISLVIGEGRIYFLKNDLDAREKAQAKAATEANISAGVFKVEREQKMDEKTRDYRRVVCLDLKTGQTLWSRPYDLTGSGGTKLGLAYQSGKLLAFGHYSNHDEGPFNKGGLNWRRITVIDGGGGSLMWSKPLNYRRRPTIMGDTIYIEPRRCDLETGEIQQRKHPITGESVEWEFLRPGHSCGIVTATPHNLFFRSYSGAIVNTEQDSGLQLFGGLRPGCWNSMIPANGLLSMQEASAGCTCSYSLRTTVVLKNKPQKGHAEWAVFISQAATKPVSHMAINFGAPGDMRDRAGTVWFGYPRPVTNKGQGGFNNYGIKFNLKEEGIAEVIQRDWRNVELSGTQNPWLYTSGLKGVAKLTVPLLDKGKKGRYTVRMGFTPLPEDKSGSRVFDIKLQGKMVLPRFDVMKSAGGLAKVIIKEFKGINVEENLLIDLTVPNLKSSTAIDVDKTLHHLGDNVVAGWTESSPEPKGFELKIPFDFEGHEDAYSLAIEQHDVHNDWAVKLNGREIGRLKRDATKQVTMLTVPERLLKKGANQLFISALGSSKDDIQVGRIKLLSGHPASTVIQSLEVIREDGPRKVANKP